MRGRISSKKSRTPLMSWVAPLSAVVSMDVGDVGGDDGGS